MSLFKFIFSKHFIKQLLLAGVALVALVFALLWWFKFSTNHGQQLEVPELSKLSIEEVEQVLKQHNMRYVVLDSANYNPDFPPYSVMEQIPAAGSMVKENRKIYLNLNPSDYPKIEIPAVVGRTLRQARPTLLSMGFEIGDIITKPYIAEDEVLELYHHGREIKPGERLKKTSIIDIVVGDGSIKLDEDEETEERQEVLDDLEIDF